MRAYELVYHDAVSMNEEEAVLLGSTVLAPENGHSMIFPQATACQMRYIRLKVCVLAHSLFQFLQETQVSSRTRANTLFILQKKKRSLDP